MGAFAGGFEDMGTHPVARFFILGFFAQNVTFGRTDFFFQHSPYPIAPPEFFFVFQNPAVCYFAHIASIAENFETVLCAGHGGHARIFLYFKVPW